MQFWTVDDEQTEDAETVRFVDPDAMQALQGVLEADVAELELELESEPGAWRAEAPSLAPVEVESADEVPPVPSGLSVVAWLGLLAGGGGLVTLGIIVLIVAIALG